MKAQSVMESAKKESVNPAFKSKYADFASIVDAVRKPLTENGLAFVQLLTSNVDGVTVTTRLLHVSGEFIETSCWMPVVAKTPQAFGSAATYAKRYALSALVGLAADADDDGNAASKEPAKPPAGADALRQQATSKPQIVDVPATRRTHEDIVMGKFGTGAGKKLSELDDNSVTFYRGACVKSLQDPERAKYHAAETVRLAAFDAELRYRGLPA